MSRDRPRRSRIQAGTPHQGLPRAARGLAKSAGHPRRITWGWRQAKFPLLGRWSVKPTREAQIFLQIHETVWYLKKNVHSVWIPTSTQSGGALLRPQLGSRWSVWCRRHVAPHGALSLKRTAVCWTSARTFRERTAALLMSYSIVLLKHYLRCHGSCSLCCFLGWKAIRSPRKRPVQSSQGCTRPNRSRRKLDAGMNQHDGTEVFDYGWSWM